MNVADTLKYVSDINAVASRYGYTVNEFDKWIKDGIIFTNSKDNEEDNNFGYKFDMKSKRISMHIQGSASWEGGYYDYDIDMNIDFFNKILELSSKI